MMPERRRMWEVAEALGIPTKRTEVCLNTHTRVRGTVLRCTAVLGFWMIRRLTTGTRSDTRS